MEMKRYKIILTLFWAVMSVLSSVRGQAIVHDPVSMGANVAGFSYQLEEAMAQTNQFFQLISNSEAQLKGLKEIQSVTSKVSNYILFMKEIEDVAMLMVSTIQDISDAVKFLSSGDFYPEEIKYLLGMYSSVLGDINTIGNSMQQLISDGEKLTSAERAEGIERRKERIDRRNKDVKRMNARTKAAYYRRREFNERIKKMNVHEVMPMLTALPCEVQPENFSGALDIPDKEDISKLPAKVKFKFDQTSFLPDIKENKTAKEATTAYKSNMTAGARLFYVISAIIAVIGALRVLQIWNQGNDISKPIVAWGGTSLFLVLVGYLIQLFFK